MFEGVRVLEGSMCQSVSFALRFLRWPVGRRWWGRRGEGVKGMDADLSVYSSVSRTGIWSGRMWSRLEVAWREVSGEGS